MSNEECGFPLKRLPAGNREPLCDTRMDRRGCCPRLVDEVTCFVDGRRKGSFKEDFGAPTFVLLALARVLGLDLARGSIRVQSLAQNSPSDPDKLHYKV